jgi:hypothetical protein
MKIFHAVFKTSEANCTPANGTRGLCWRAAAHYDPGSIEYRAWLFKPNNSPNAYYCDAFCLKFGTEVKHRSRSVNADGYLVGQPT